MDSCPPHGYSEPLAKRPQSPHASASRSFNGQLNQQYGFQQNRVGVDYGSLPDAAPCAGGVLRHKRLSQDGQLENPGLIR